jgi:hypothetical protein
MRKSSSIIVQRIQEGKFGDLGPGSSASPSSGKAPPSFTSNDEGSITEGAVGKMPSRGSKAMKGYDSFQQIGGMGGEMAWPWHKPNSIVEPDSEKNHTVENTSKSRAQSGSGKGKIDKDAADNIADENTRGN